MRQLHGLLAVAALLAVSSASSAYAACCGAVRYKRLRGLQLGEYEPLCDPTYTVMRTRVAGWFGSRRS
ncbi:MAG: hypothetical protein R3B96_19695 [Pirellulaceae bacterium]